MGTTIPFHLLSNMCSLSSIFIKFIQLHKVFRYFGLQGHKAQFTMMQSDLQIQNIYDHNLSLYSSFVFGSERKDYDSNFNDFKQSAF